ncbi:FMRFamide receptor-like protein [Leptotrombidium deliense]|uniref:FMRFamide receptor-like protein n=1 Tax=Leptotrombidium deliense TaxID=299467 RepID=A0A443SVD2_9ACAR|nr:FMRFamide receptor-like protein [Leptotrombidium deliense]
MDDVKYFYYWKVFPFFLMIVDACTNISVWLTVTFTIERFIVVSHPIKGKVICTESRAKKVILCVFMICFTFVIPTPFEWVIVENVDPQTNRTYITPDASEFGRNQLYKIVFSWVYSILFVFIPLLLLAVFNSFLIRSVHLSKKQRSVMTQSKLRNPGKSSQTSDTNNVANARPSGGKFDQSSKQETKITVMLISVVILFLICQLPVAGMLIYTSVRTVPPKTNEFYLLTGLNNIFNFMVAVNAAGNFVLYCLLSEKYRRTLVKLFCPCLKGKLSHLQSSYHQTLYSKTTGAGKFGFETEDQTEFRNFDGCKRGSSASPQAMKNVLEAKSAEERKLLKATRNSSNRKPANNNNSNSNQRSNVSVLPIINVNKHCCDSSGTGNSLDTSCDVEIRDVSKTVGETRNDCDVSEKE